MVKIPAVDLSLTEVVTSGIVNAAMSLYSIMFNSFDAAEQLLAERPVCEWCSICVCLYVCVCMCV